MGYEVRESPNFNERDAAVRLQYIVIHYTGMRTAEEWVAAVCDPKTELSAHYLVDEDGRVVQLVDESKRAWHAGKSFWRGITDMNSASIGIELQNPGHENGYREFPAAQIEVLKNLLRDIIRRHGLDARRCLLGHSDIAPTRKIDPGELFPWKELAEEGLGVWSVVHDAVIPAKTGIPCGFSLKENKWAPHFPASPCGLRRTGRGDDANGLFQCEFFKLLAAIGYDCSSDDVAKASMTAFLRRFQPERVEVGPDEKTVGFLRVVAQGAAV